MLQTRLSELFDLRYPIVSAPMAGHSSAGLAAAVSAAGGLGTFGGVNRGGAAWVRGQIRVVRERTGRPFGVGFITHWLHRHEESFAVCLEERVPVIAFSFADPGPWVGRAKAAGARVLCQVQDAAGARLAVAAGADVIVAQGTEAGGHTGTLGTLACLEAVLAVAGETPVIAAGGIGSGRALAAVLAAGAEGAWLGTALLATPEATEVSDAYKRAIVESDGADTVYSSVYDIIGGEPWPAGIAGRSRANALTRAWHGREDELRARREEVYATISPDPLARDIESGPIWMGTSAAAVRAVRPVAEVLAALSDEAEALLRARAAALTG